MKVKPLRFHVDKRIRLIEIQEVMGQETQRCWNREMGKSGFPLSGFNDNLDFMGKLLHVQTESVGFPVACIVTQVFCKGKVILSRRSDFPSGVRENGEVAKMRELMHAQHLQTIQNIADKQARIQGTQ
jgi:hypothetical protein